MNKGSNYSRCSFRENLINECAHFDNLHGKQSQGANSVFMGGRGFETQFSNIGKI